MSFLNKMGVNNKNILGLEKAAVTYSKATAIYTAVGATVFGLLFIGVGIFLLRVGYKDNKKRMECGCNNDQVCVTDECTEIPEGNARPKGQMWWGAGIGIVALIVIIGAWWRFVLIKNNDIVATSALFDGF